MQPKPRQDLRPLHGPRFAIAAVLAIALALLVGCGDDNGATSAEPVDTAGDNGAAVEEVGEAAGGEEPDEAGLSEEPIAKRAFVKQANRICDATVGTVLAKAGPILGEAREESIAAREDAEVELVETVMAPGLRREVARIGAIGAPPGDRRQIERFLAAVQEIAERAESNPESLAGYNQTFFARPTRLADAYGLDSCPYG
jgi:hypothetical protein